MTWAGDFFSALADRWPALRGNLSASWRNFSAWKRLEPPVQAKPASRLILRWWLYSLLVGLSAANFYVVLPTLLHIVLVRSLCRHADVRGLLWSDIEILPDGLAEQSFASIIRKRV